MSPATVDELLARYAELEALLTRAIAACQTKDQDQAVLISYGITQKLITLDERLLEIGILPKGARREKGHGADGLQVSPDLQRRVEGPPA